MTPESSAARSTLAAITSRVNDRGFFHLEVIPPGKWELLVQQDGFSPARQVVTIVEGAEASLSRPIQLSRPSRLEVQLTPPQDPDGKPWRVKLIEQKPNGQVAYHAEAAATLGGQWVADVASGAEYKAQVKTSSGQSWYLDEAPFTPTGSPFKRSVEVELESVRGRVRLGKTPLRSSLVFGRENGSISVRISSDEEGRAVGSLPRLGKWAVSVSADEPAIRRNLAEVEVRRASNGSGDFEIVLGDKTIQGEIVEENGRLSDYAIVSLRLVGKAESVQQTVEGGTFRLAGFDAGSYVISAEGRGTRTEDQQLTISGDEQAEPVRLVLRKKKGLQLRVVSPSQASLVGATAWFVPTAGSSQGFYPKTTDASGRVAFTVSAETVRQCILVVGGGFSTRLLSVPVTEEETIVSLASDGGSLRLDFPTPSAEAFPRLSHGGCEVSPGFLGANSGGENGGRSLFNLEPGDYTLCLHRSAQLSPRAPVCAQGNLGPFRTLALTPTPGSGDRRTPGGSS